MPLNQDNPADPLDFRFEHLDRGLVVVFRIFVACLVLGGFSSAWADSDSQDTSAISLQDAFLAARESSPVFRAAGFKVDAAEAERYVARGQVLPQVSLFGEWSDNSIRYDSPLSGVYGEQNYPGERYGFQLRQSLFNMSRWREIERANAEFDRERNNLEQAEIELLQAVTEAYLKVAVADQTVQQFKMESDALKQQLGAARALYQRALMPITQLLETQTRFESVSADLIDANGEAAVAREELISLVGFRNFYLMPINSDVVLDTHAVSATQVAQMAVENSPAIAAAQDGVEAARVTIEREKGSWWPEIDLVVSQQYSDVGFDNLSSPPRTTDSVSLAISYPLIQGGAGSARIRGAWAKFYGARQELERIRRLLNTQSRSAWVRFEAANDRLRAVKRAITSAEVNVDAAEKSVKAGTARLTDVLLALAQSTAVNRDYAYAQFQRVSAWLELELISGAEPQAIAAQLSDAMLVTSAVSAKSLNQ
ncbi:TolC family protein [bacterium]|nr:TolC family protein [bacterium]